LLFKKKLLLERNIRYIESKEVSKYYLGGIMMTKINKTIKILLANVKIKVENLKVEISALYLASKRDDVPWYAKLVIILVVGYALSPIDLIPDFIPIIGYLDDIIILPMGIMLAIRLIPENIMDECRQESATAFKNGKPKNWFAAGIIIFIWIVIVIYVLIKIFQ